MQILFPIPGQTQTPNEVLGGGVIQSVNWDALIPSISDFVRLRPDEFIEAILVNDTDLRVKISRKKGRKQKS